MLKKLVVLAAALSLLLTGMAVPAALASDYYSARTPLAGSSSAKINNVQLAVDAINGTRVANGGSFSFNETVGRRTQARGYKTAPNGRGVKVTGGGVAQAASTLYLALLKVRGGVSIDPVKTYGSRYTDSYVEDSDYAVITDYDADIDLSFTNYGEPMSIDMWMNDSYVYCSITVGDDVFAGEDDSAAGSSADPSQWGSWGDWIVSSLEPEGDSDDDDGQRVLLSSASLDCGDDGDVIYNASLAADSITDTTLGKGGIFSFNDIVGPRTRAYGYRRAVNGRGAKVIGGGVAQVASAIWLAIKDLDDVSIVEKSTYGDRYNQGYVSSSADAILTDYSAGRDFSFRYNGSGSLTVYTYVQDDTLYCDIYEDSATYLPSASWLDNVG